MSRKAIQDMISSFAPGVSQASLLPPSLARGLENRIPRGLMIDVQRPGRWRVEGDLLTNENALVTNENSKLTD